MSWFSLRGGQRDGTLYASGPLYGVQAVLDVVKQMRLIKSSVVIVDDAAHMVLDFEGFKEATRFR